MPNKPSRTNQIKLDPIFSIPAGAEDIFVFSKDNPNLTDDLWDFVNDDLTLVDDSIIDDSVTDTDSTELGVPDDFTIESQNIHPNKGGTTVVDIVVAIDDVPGADGYEIELVRV